MRTRKLLYVCATLLYFCCFADYVVAQSTTYGMGELNIISSMRSAALGEATVAMDGYPGAAQINPASIGLYHVIQGSSYIFGGGGSIFQRRSWIRGVSLYQPNFDYRSNKWAVALYTTYFNMGTQTETDEQGNLIGSNHSYQMGISASGSWELTSHLRVGLGLRYLTSKLFSPPQTVGNVPLHNAHSFAVDLGLLYQPRLYKTEYLILQPSVGWSITNFGAPLRYASIDSPYFGSIASDPLPMTMRGGIGLRLTTMSKMYKEPVVSVGLYTELSHILARRDGNGKPYGPFKALFKGWSPDSLYSFFTGDYQHYSFADQFYTHFGIEVTLFGALSYRYGYINQPTALGFDNKRMFGVGIDLYYIMFDYTNISTQSRRYHYLNDGGVWQVTVRIPFEKPTRGLIPSLLNR